MRENFNLLDIVTLIEDLPERNLWRGQVGTIVDVFADGVAFEVEFSDGDGRVYNSLGLRPDQIMELYFEPISRSGSMVAAV